MRVGSLRKGVNSEKNISSHKYISSTTVTPSTQGPQDFRVLSTSRSSGGPDSRVLLKDGASRVVGDPVCRSGVEYAGVCDPCPPPERPTPKQKGRRSLLDTLSDGTSTRRRPSWFLSRQSCIPFVLFRL